MPLRHRTHPPQGAVPHIADQHSDTMIRAGSRAWIFRRRNQGLLLASLFATFLFATKDWRTFCDSVPADYNFCQKPSLGTKIFTDDDGAKEGGALSHKFPTTNTQRFARTSPRDTNRESTELAQGLQVKEDMPLSLVILKRPRTGSTWLSAQLNTIEGLRSIMEPLTDMNNVRPFSCPDEFYPNAMVQMLQGSCYRNYLRRQQGTPLYFNTTCDAPSVSDGKCRKRDDIRAVTILINRFFIPNGTLREIQQRSPNTKFVHLYRTNLIKQSVSNAIRTLKGVETIEGSGKNKKIALNQARILGEANRSIRLYNDFHDFLENEGIEEYVELSYEQLQWDNTAALTWMFHQLGGGFESFATGLDSINKNGVRKRGKERICDTLLNCDYLKEQLKSNPCLVAQLDGDGLEAWSIPKDIDSTCSRTDINIGSDY